MSIKVVFSDVDGVLTDNRVYYPGMVRAFNVLDGHGVEMLAEEGIDVVFMSGENDPGIHDRCKKLQVPFWYTKKKLYIAEQYASANGIRLQSEAVFIGNDIPDIPLLLKVAIPACPQNAVPEVISLISAKRNGILVPRKGGDGAFRELVSRII